MSSQAIEFGGRSPESGPFRRELAPEGLVEALVQARSGVPPVAYVVRAQDLAPLRKCRDLIVDRGRKHKSKPLARLLLRQERIPLVEAPHYTNPGQTMRGIRDLLDNAVQAGERNVYVIGVSETLWAELWKRAAQRAQDRAADGNGARAEAGAAFEDPSSPEYLLKILPPREVPEDFGETFVGDSPAVRLVRQLILLAAAAPDTQVLIQGETGTGKEVVARAIHRHGPHADKPFVAVNCAAIVETLFEAELFGIEPGVATNVTGRIGKFEQAGDGTLFLDEIGELPLGEQAKILRALEEKKIRRVGGVKEIPVNARVIAATNRDLAAMVHAGEFRIDLYYRLSKGIPISTLALRDQPDQIPHLAESLWKKHFAGERGRRLPPPLLDRLRSYSWPGNVRQLMAVLGRLRDMFPEQELTLRHLEAAMASSRELAPPQKPAPIPGDALALHRGECLQHLKKVDEVLRAIKVALRPLLKDGRTDRRTARSVLESVRLRLGELDVLCLRPAFFGGPAVSRAVYEFKGKVMGLERSLAAGAREAIDYWEQEAADKFKSAQAAVLGEVEHLTNVPLDRML
jgi:DNA-binding NtrC family response regulator